MEGTGGAGLTIVTWVVDKIIHGGLPPLVLYALLGIGILMMLHAGGTYLAIAARHRRSKGAPMLPLYGMVFFGVGFVGCFVWYLATQPTQEAAQAAPTVSATHGGPIVRIRTEPVDANISWQDAQLFPANADHGSPFFVRLKNIGADKAIDAEVRFSVATSFDEVFAEMQASQIFPAAERNGNELRLPLTYVLNKPTMTFSIGFSGDDLVRRTIAIESDGAWRFEYPAVVKNVLSILALSRAFVIGRGQMDGSDNPFLGKPLTEANQRSLEEYLRRKMADSNIPLPDVTVSVRYFDRAGKAFNLSETIRSIYRVTAPPFWYWEDERKEKLVFKGGFGILSFEDRENPDNGLYNEAKRLRQ